MQYKKKAQDFLHQLLGKYTSQDNKSFKKKNIYDVLLTLLHFLFWGKLCHR